MSKETARSLQNAKTVASVQTTLLDERRNELLVEIARDLPARVDELARQVVAVQGVASRALGAEGLQEMRDSLRALSRDLSLDVVASDSVEWPQFDDDAPVEVENVQWELQEFFENEAPAFIKVFEDRAYDIDDDKVISALFEGGNFVDRMKAVADAQTSANEAGRVLAAAQESDDRLAAIALWNGTK